MARDQDEEAVERAARRIAELQQGGKSGAGAQGGSGDSNRQTAGKPPDGKKA